MSEGDYEGHLRRRASAHVREAQVHDQAAVAHEVAAASFEEHNRPDKALRERALADREVAKAADARDVALADAAGLPLTALP